MSGKERRVSPRKECAVPLRFRILTNDKPNTPRRVAKPSAYHDSLEGEAINLSERGVCFRSPEKVSVGEPLEMFFTLPRELTGRSPEPVRCSARVVHVAPQADQQGKIGVGVIVECFEPVANLRNWDN